MRPFLITLVLALTAAACSSGDDTGAATSTVTPAPTTSAPTPASTTAAPEGSGISGQEEAVTLVTGDGVTLEGRRFGSGSTGVVLAHMRPASMESWFDFARVLAEGGYSALAFNFRGYGNSEGDGFAVDVDTAAAIDFLTASGATNVIVIGASMGGTGAVAASAERSTGGAVTLSAPDAFEGTDAVAAAATYAGPLLLIAAENDRPYSEDAVAIAGASAGEAQVAILPGGAHGTNLFDDHGGAVTSLILEFVATNG